MKRKYKTLSDLEANHDDLGRFVKGNTIRLKWTRKKTLKTLLELKKILDGDVSNEICIIHHLVNKLNLSKVWLTDMERKFADDEEIVETIDLIKGILEGRVWTKTSKNEINPYLGLFTLKAYFGNVEKQYIQTENTNKDEVNTNVNLNVIYPTKDKII